MRIVGAFAVLLLASVGFCVQPPPQDFGYSRNSDWLIDAGLLWDANRLFHPLESPEGSDSLPLPEAYRWLGERRRAASQRAAGTADDEQLSYLSGIIGDRVGAEWGAARRYEGIAASFFVWFQGGIGKHWYFRSSAQGSNRPASLDHFSGDLRDISRFGFSAAEVDQGVIGYQRDWLRVEFGRSREIWGPFPEENLTLAGSSPSYERLLLEARGKRLSYRFFYGFLESASDTANVNRYLAGRAIEYRNGKNLVLGVSEVSVLAGVDRPVDWAFLNPVAIHVDVEQNNRANVRDYGADVDYSLYVDWLPHRNLRLAGSLDIDDFQVDAADRKKFEDPIGWQGRLAWTPIYAPVGITALADYVRIGTYSMQHQNPYCNLVTHGNLIGHPLGNDAEEIKAGLRMISPARVMAEIRLGSRRWGSNSLKEDPYKPYITPAKSPFPSGVVRRSSYFEFELESYPRNWLRLMAGGRIDLTHTGPSSLLEQWRIRAEWYFPFRIEGGA